MKRWRYRCLILDWLIANKSIQAGPYFSSLQKMCLANFFSLDLPTTYDYYLIISGLVLQKP